METALWIFAAIGLLVVLWFATSLIVGNFGDKTKTGKHYLRKRFKQIGIGPSQFSDAQLMRISFNAFTVTQYGGLSERRFDNTEFVRQLDYRADLIASYIKGVALNEDAISLVRALLDAPNSLSNATAQSPSSS